MGSKQAIPVALFAGGLPYVGAGAGNVGPLNGGDYVHVVVPDGAGGFNSRVTTLADLIAQVPASGISQAFADGRYLRRDQELADLLDFVAARNDLNVYSKAEVNAAITAAIAGAGASSSLYPAPIRPVDGSFSWFNQGTATKTVNANGSISIVLPQQASIQWRGRILPLASPNAFTLKTGLFHSIGEWNYTGQHVGIILYDSVSGKLVVFGQYTDSGATYILASNYTNSTTVSGNINVARVSYGSYSPMYLQMTGDGTTYRMGLSRDGYAYSNWANSLYSAFIPNPTHVGFGGYESGNGMPVSISCFDWSLT